MKKPFDRLNSFFVRVFLFCARFTRAMVSLLTASHFGDGK